MGILGFGRQLLRRSGALLSVRQLPWIVLGAGLIGTAAV